MGEKTYEYIFQIAKDCDGVYCYIKQGELIRCGECEHFRQEPDGEMWCGVSKGHGIDKDFFCGDAERRTE